MPEIEKQTIPPGDWIQVLHWPGWVRHNSLRNEWVQVVNGELTMSVEMEHRKRSPFQADPEPEADRA